MPDVATISLLMNQIRTFDYIIIVVMFIMVGSIVCLFVIKANTKDMATFVKDNANYNYSAANIPVGSSLTYMADKDALQAMTTANLNSIVSSLSVISE